MYTSVHVHVDIKVDSKRYSPQPLFALVTEVGFLSKTMVWQFWLVSLPAYPPHTPPQSSGIPGDCHAWPAFTWTPRIRILVFTIALQTLSLSFVPSPGSLPPSSCNYSHSKSSTLEKFCKELQAQIPTRKVVLDSSPLPHKKTPSELFPLRDQEAVAMCFHGTNGSSSPSGGNVALQVSLYDQTNSAAVLPGLWSKFWEKKNISSKTHPKQSIQWEGPCFGSRHRDWRGNW